MKVKLKKRKKSPAPCLTEQVKVKSTIETLRNARAYRVPIHVIYDRGYKQTINLASVIQKANEKIPAPLVVEQVSIENAQKHLEGYGTKICYPVFGEDEKERASKIVEQLRGLTIREAQEFLEKVSEAIISSCKI